MTKKKRDKDDDYPEYKVIVIQPGQSPQEAVDAETEQGGWLLFAAKTAAGKLYLVLKRIVRRQ